MEFSVAPTLDGSFKTLLSWLDKNEFRAVENNTKKKNNAAALNLEESLFSIQITQQQIRHRHQVAKTSKKERQEIKKDYETRSPIDIDIDHLIYANQDPSSFVRQLNWEPLSRDILGFYKAFHNTDERHWGIYLHADSILEYAQMMYKQSSHIRLWDENTLLHLIVYDIFQHEFYHHLVESAATHMEVLAAAFGQPRKIYLDYKHRQRHIKHPHHPLEEALANAYAYNAIGFICRMQQGFKTGIVKTFQQASKNTWRFEPAGYCSAANYIGNRHVAGNACLLEQMLNIPNAADNIPLSSISKHLMPNGYSALKSKPDIPCYIIGSAKKIQQLNTLIPALHATYTQLFLPYNHTELDQKFQNHRSNHYYSPS